MNYWWVNQNQTYEQEIGGGYMWSPQKQADGKNTFHYDNMKLVKKGDVIFSYYNQEIQAIGIVLNEAYEASKPEEFGPTGGEWDNHGWKVDMHYKAISFPLSPLDIWDTLRLTLPEKYSPLNANGGGYQGYLFNVPSEMAALLFSNLVFYRFSL